MNKDCPYSPIVEYSAVRMVEKVGFISNCGISDGSYDDYFGSHWHQWMSYRTILGLAE
jgi:hypothetical protein